MTDPSPTTSPTPPTSAPPSETTTPPAIEPPTPKAKGVLLDIPTTEFLTQERLEEIATDCVLTFTPLDGDAGIRIVAMDAEDAAFWNRRGGFWAEQARIRAS